MAYFTAAPGDTGAGALAAQRQALQRQAEGVSGDRMSTLVQLLIARDRLADRVDDDKRSACGFQALLVVLVDPQRFYVQTDKIGLVGRMHGRGWYARTSDLFLMDRMTFADWQGRR